MLCQEKGWSDYMEIWCFFNSEHFRYFIMRYFFSVSRTSEWSWRAFLYAYSRYTYSVICITVLTKKEEKKKQPVHVTQISQFIFNPLLKRVWHSNGSTKEGGGRVWKFGVCSLVRHCLPIWVNSLLYKAYSECKMYLVAALSMNIPGDVIS